MEGAWKKVMEKVADMSHGELRRVWNALRDYGSEEFYDEDNGITMDDWVHLIYQQMSSRCLLVM